ncbi:MAG: hypothetical protein KFW07_01575 [Mycoplasmataceae bacterium]|nr:hypothetical protein [Mycoplasmataceae bacterium]
MLLVSFLVCSITNIVVVWASQNDRTTVMSIIFLIINITIWFFPIYLIVLTIINYLNFKKEFSTIQNEKELYDKMNNKLIRELVVKNGIKISIFTDKKTDFEKFKQVINHEIKFQRQKIELLNSN